MKLSLILFIWILTEINLSEIGVAESPFYNIFYKNNEAEIFEFSQ